VKGRLAILKQTFAILVFSALSASESGAFVIGSPDFPAFWAGPDLKISAIQSAPAQPKAAFEANQASSFSMDRAVPGFGYTATHYAARIDLVNKTSLAMTAHLIVYGPIERFYVQDEGREGAAGEIRSAGMYVRPEPGSGPLSRYSHFTLKLAPGLNTFYFSLEAVAPHFPLLLMSDREFSMFSTEQNMMAAGFLAVSALILLFATGVALVIRDKLSAIYVAWTFFSFLFNLFVTGACRPFLYLVFGPSRFGIATEIESFLHSNWIIWWAVAQATSLLFGGLFLGIPILGRSIASRLLQFGLLASILLAVTSEYNPVLAINAFTAPYQIVLGYFCFRSFKQGRSGYLPAYCLLGGWGVYAVASTLMLSYYFGVIGPSFLTSWGILFSNLAQALSLGAAMFWDRKNRERDALKQIRRNFRELAERDQIIQEYSSPKIVSEISLGIDPRLYSSRWTDFAILFSDMRDFTALIENADLPTVEEILNTYLGEIVECTFDFNGEVNKMIGDAVMCIFENPRTCLEATVALRKRLSNLNRARVAAGNPPIKFGSGVSYSRVISMNVGRHGKKLDRTVIGDEVNIAARIEAMTKELGVDLLVSQKFQGHVADYPYQRPMGNFLLKGKSTPTGLHEIFGHNSEKVIEYKLSTVPGLKQVLALCEGDAFADADAILSEMIAKCPPHTFLKGQIMDRTLLALRARLSFRSGTKSRVA
jgi:class 3 adenylate cyclase